MWLLCAPYYLISESMKHICKLSGSKGLWYTQALYAFLIRASFTEAIVAVFLRHLAITDHFIGVQRTREPPL